MEDPHKNKKLGEHQIAHKTKQKLKKLRNTHTHNESDKLLLLQTHGIKPQ